MMMKTIDYKKIILLQLALAFLVLAVEGCGKKEQPKAVKPATYAARKVEPAQVEKETESFVYVSKDRRDPFVPVGLVAEAFSKAGSVDIALLELKGILNSRTEKKKYALLSGPGGDKYILKDGILLNLNNKAISGVKGTIGEDRVTLITDKQYMRVLNIERPKAEKSGLKIETFKEK